MARAEAAARAGSRKGVDAAALVARALAAARARPRCALCGRHRLTRCSAAQLRRRASRGRPGRQWTARTPRNDRAVVRRIWMWWNLSRVPVLYSFVSKLA